jgi:uncharacterized protein
MKKLAIIGSSGFIGSALVKTYDDYDIVKISGRNFNSLNAQEIAGLLENTEIAINLAGYPVFGWWSARNKQLILNSRVKLTRNLSEALKICTQPPALLINASAIGIYSDDKVHSEISNDFSGNFLGNVVSDWEKAALSAKSDRTGIAIIRIGMVLGMKGGAYPIVRKLIKWRLGSWFGSGNQGFSFIWIDDLVRAIRFISDNHLTGVVNLTSPNPLSYKEFIKTAAARLRVRILWPIPLFVIRLLFGEASVLFTEGQKVVPEVLTRNGFIFYAPDLKSCIETIAAP